MIIMIGTVQRSGICWAINNHEYQCFARSTHVVTVLHQGFTPVDSCAQHLAKIIDHVGQASGQSPSAPMSVSVFTVPKGK